MKTLFILLIISSFISVSSWAVPTKGLQESEKRDKTVAKKVLKQEKNQQHKSLKKLNNLCSCPTL